MKSLNHTKKYTVMMVTALIIPFQALAQNASDANQLVKFFSNIINVGIIPIVITLVLIYTMYSVAQYILESQKGDSSAKGEKKQQIFWGIMGLFVIISIWSLVGVLQNTFGILGGGVLR